MKDKDTGQQVPITNGQHALFAILLRDMKNCADKYNTGRDPYVPPTTSSTKAMTLSSKKKEKWIAPSYLSEEDCLKILYEVSGDRQKLLQVLRNRRLIHSMNLKRHNMHTEQPQKQQKSTTKSKKDNDGDRESDEDYQVS